MALLSAAAPSAQAQGWLITLVDGQASVLDGSSRVTAAPGLRLSPAAIIETGASTTLLRLENAEQTSLDLGPATRAMLLPPGFAPRGGKAPLLYLLTGWAKLGTRDAGNTAGVVTPDLELMPFAGVAVLQVSLGAQAVFAESGRLDLAERRAGGATQALSAGQFYSASAGSRGDVQSRPAPVWLTQLPRAFRDTLPLRGAAARDLHPEPSPLPRPNYVDLQPWLDAEPTLRRAFPKRFAALAREPAFRTELQWRMSAHPEWEPVLHPPPRPSSDTPPR